MPLSSGMIEVFGPDRRRKRFDGVREIECLAAQQHDVEFFVEPVRLHRRRVLQRDVAIRALDHEAGAGKLRRALRADQERDVAAGLQHPAAKISADRAGADHENTHRSGFLVVVVRRQLRNGRPIRLRSSERPSTGIREVIIRLATA